MLKKLLLNEPQPEESGLLREASQDIERFRRRLHDYNGRQKEGATPKYRRIELWTSGLMMSLSELDQSVYAAGRYAERIRKTSLSNMTEEEQQDYYLHVYYYKNAFIRLFSLFDKIGYFLNDLLDLQTEKTKPRFSYFTVLRQMQKNHTEEKLANTLYSLKDRYDEPLRKLREQRNTEIHFMNAEMQDDLLRVYEKYNPKEPLENVKQNMADLRQGLEAALHTLREVFTESYRRIAESQA
ncbi:Cthe_2314 family HEPN domain-containing protein [Paenibacillus gansuensis]|uniref:Cthe_2314 family HEPN domain-containing protein n=1 Tax=Paenibacillus gansuensis TaxID=306542 RepID=A0ABW5PG71_9BACL